MAQTLALQYRPKSLDQMIGQDDLVSSVRKQMSSKREPNAWLFFGEPGAGKTSIARILAIAYQCSHKEKFGTFCSKCWKRRKAFNIYEVNAAEVSGVEEIEAIIETAQYMPTDPSKKRVYVIDECQRLSAAAQQLLLKVLEDSPKTTKWILCTSEPHKISAALRRRCIDYAMKPLSIKGVKALINWVCEEAQLKLKKIGDFIEEVNKSGLTSPGVILKCLDKFASGTSAQESVMGGDVTVDKLAICQAVVKGDIEGLHKHLRESIPGDAPLIISSVGSYLRAIIHKNPTQANDKQTYCIRKLAETARCPEFIQLPMLTAVLHEATRKFGGGKVIDDDNSDDVD